MLNEALGTWSCKIETFIFSGELKMTVLNNGGEYGFQLEVEGMDTPDFEFTSIEENGSNVKATVYVPAVKREAELDITFDGDRLNGTIKVPMLGKIKLKDGKKIG